MNKGTHDYVDGFTLRVWRGVPVDDPFSHGQTPNGDQELDWSAPVLVTEQVRCPVALEQAYEQPTPAAPLALVASLTAYLAYGTDVTARDRVEVTNGPYAGTYEVDGRPAHWLNPYTGARPGCVVRLGDKTGG